MRYLRILSILASMAILVCAAAAEKNAMGIHDVSRVTFVAPVRVGSTLLPAGEYLVRHTMQGQDHVMVFEAVKTKTVAAKAKCNLVPLSKKAEQSHTVYQMNTANERVLQELVVRGDTAKHVFGE
jgi:acyl dehydratase